MRKIGRAQRVQKVVNENLERSSFSDLPNGTAAFPTYFVSVYLANAIVYLASSRKRTENVRTINKSITYLKAIYSHPYEPKKIVWDNASISDIGFEFKSLTHIIRHELLPEDIEKALICLIALRDLIQNGSDVTQVIHAFKAKQVMHELKHGLKLSLPDEKE